MKQVVTEVVTGRSAPEVPERPPVRGPVHRALPAPRDPAALDRLVGLTPARIAQGRTGTRYLTESYKTLAQTVPDALAELCWCDAAHLRGPRQGLGV